MIKSHKNERHSPFIDSLCPLLILREIPIARELPHQRNHLNNIIFQKYSTIKHVYVQCICTLLALRNIHNRPMINMFAIYPINQQYKFFITKIHNNLICLMRHNLSICIHMSQIYIFNLVDVASYIVQFGTTIFDVYIYSSNTTISQ